MNRRDFGRPTAGVLTALVSDPLQLADICAAPHLPWHHFALPEDEYTRYTGITSPYVQNKLMFATDARWMLRAEARPWQSETEGVRLPNTESAFQAYVQQDYGPWLPPTAGILEYEEKTSCECTWQHPQGHAADNCEDCRGLGYTRFAKTRLGGVLVDDDRLRQVAKLPRCEIRASKDRNVFHFRCTGAEGLLMAMIESQ